MQNNEVSASGRRSRWRRDERETKNGEIKLMSCQNNDILNKNNKSISYVTQCNYSNANNFDTTTKNLKNDNIHTNVITEKKNMTVNDKIIKTKWGINCISPLLLDTAKISSLQHTKNDSVLDPKEGDLSYSCVSSAASFPVDKSSKKISLASKFAIKALKSEVAMCNSQLVLDVQKALEGGTIYLPSFFCNEKDLTIYSKLEEDIKKEEETKKTGSLVKWSKHLKLENPEFSDTFKKILEQMADYFDVKIYATRLNYYRNGNDWKPFHHDSHAYITKHMSDSAKSNDEHSEKLVEDFTMGASFGASRHLVFLHESSTQQFSFPQNNGDVFAFTSQVNKSFKHGVPKDFNQINKIFNNNNNFNVEGRFSVIAWGKRKTLNERNAAISEIRLN